MEKNNNRFVVKEILNKIKVILSNFKSKISPKLLEIDTKFAEFMPNPKLRKLAYITSTSLFGFMFLIIILGLLLSPFRNNGATNQSLFKKPNIIQESPKSQTKLNENQKQINEFKKEIDNLNFPDTRINIPIIENNLSIDQSR
jgi:hypothetical protein